MIELKNVTKKIGDRKILKNVNFTFGNTGLFLITGDNGSGKSTLLYILGLLDNNFGGEYIIHHQNYYRINQEYIKGLICHFHCRQ